MSTAEKLPAAQVCRKAMDELDKLIAEASTRATSIRSPAVPLMARRCLGCGTLCSATRCTACQRDKYRRRNADRPLAKALTTQATHCARCGVELTHDDPQGPAGPTAQHVTAFADGGTLTPDAPVICRSCNSSLGRG